MKKIVSITLMMIMVLMAALLGFTQPAFAAPVILNGNRYQTFDVKAPHGSIVVIEAYDYKQNGVVDDTGKNTGEFGPGIFSDQIESFFKVSPLSYLEVGDYYYKITLKDKGVPNVEYDDREYIVWVNISYKTNDQGQYLDENDNVVPRVRQAAKCMSIVLQKDDTYEKPLDIIFENTLVNRRTVKRIITYTEYTPDGKEVSRTLEETVTLIRRVRCDSDGNPIDKDGNTISLDDEDKLIYIGENGNPLGYDTSGRPYLTDGSGNPLRDANGNIRYTTKWNIEKVTPDGRAASPIVPGADGRAMVTTPIVSPPHREGGSWAPDKNSVDGWLLNLNSPPPDGYVEKIPVVYIPQSTEDTEYKTIKRTITYTKWTPDGEKIVETVEQIVVIKRSKTTNPVTGETTYGDWEIDGGDRSAVTSPKKGTWTPDRSVVPEWVIDLKNPQDAYENVVYTTSCKADPGFEKVVTGNPPSAAKFVFVLKADDKNYPMPDGSIGGVRKITSIGGGFYEFGDIIFGGKNDPTGVYVYTMYEETGNDKSYAYDKTVYTLKITVAEVNGELTAKQEITANGKTFDKATFTNKFDPDVTPTGDLLNPLLWGGILGAAVIAIVVIIIVKRRKKEDEE